MNDNFSFWKSCATFVILLISNTQLFIPKVPIKFDKEQQTMKARSFGPHKLMSSKRLE